MHHRKQLHLNADIAKADLDCKIDYLAINEFKNLNPDSVLRIIIDSSECYLGVRLTKQTNISDLLAWLETDLFSLKVPTSCNWTLLASINKNQIVTSHMLARKFNYDGIDIELFPSLCLKKFLGSHGHFDYKEECRDNTFHYSKMKLQYEGEIRIDCSCRVEGEREFFRVVLRDTVNVYTADAQAIYK